MQLEELRHHLRRGGAATLNHPASYGVADGAIIAPARYAGRNGGANFVFEIRHLGHLEEGGFRRTVLIDSKQSQANRIEDGLLAARLDGGAAAQIPTIEVKYEGRESLNDLQLPARAFDSHVRFASQNGEPVTATAWYRDLRDATFADLSPVFTTAPAILNLGGWDSSRRSGQLRLRGLVVSELFGVVSDAEDRVSRRSGARLDPLGQAFNVSPEELERLVDLQRFNLSPRLVAKLEKSIADARRKKTETISAAELNLGGIPPSLESPFGVSVPEVRRARTFSLAGLRRLRFGGDPDDDVAAREALLAMLLLGVAYADADPALRAYCDVTAPRATTLLDEKVVELDLSIDSCERYLAQAVDRLPQRLQWRGQVQALVGDPSLGRGAVDVVDDDE